MEESRNSNRRAFLVMSDHKRDYVSNVGLRHLDIHAAPRQGPPAPRSQGVINASGFV